MARCRLRFPARACALVAVQRQSIDSEWTVDPQSHRAPVETGMAGFQGAPEEAEVAEASFCEHRSGESQ